jgi:hypothetical protein
MDMVVGADGVTETPGMPGSVGIPSGGGAAVGGTETPGIAI